jgi:hypothetical protein
MDAKSWDKTFERFPGEVRHTHYSMSGKLQQEEGPRALTLTNLLILMSFVCAAESVLLPIRNAGGGLGLYIVGAIVALALGVSVVWLE